MTELQSNFLAPGIQFAWDSTSLGWLKKCPRLYYYQSICGYRPRGESLHLFFGQLYHSALERYDHLRAQGEDHATALHRTIWQLMLDSVPWPWEHNSKTRENLVRTVVWYIEEFVDDKATTIILANGKPAVELSFKFELNSEVVLAGHLDRVVDFLGDPYVMDRKTTTITVSPYYFDQYEPDNQMSLYSMAGQVILGSPVKGVIIDAAQVAVNFSRFQRGLTYRTETQLREWSEDTMEWVHAAWRMADRHKWPMNDKSCHDFGGCAFRKVCSRDPAVRETFLQSDFEVRPWNPLVPR